MGKEDGNIMDLNIQNVNDEWNRALIICFERSVDMVNHGIAKILIYNTIMYFVQKNKGNLKDRLVVIPYSQNAVRI